MVGGTPAIQDDKSPFCIPFILERLDIHRQQHENEDNPPPFFLGLNGVQGAGKTVLVSIIQETLQTPPYNLPTVVFSLDDLYLTHADQVKLAQEHPDNPLVQHRGQPSTHDIPLGCAVFSSLRRNEPTRIPQYNKAAFSGQGDRVPEASWEEVNAGQGKDRKVTKVVLFEGWSVGFRPLDPVTLKQKWRSAVQARERGNYVGRLGYNSLESLAHINASLKEYDEITNQLDAFMHIDAHNPQYVYKWRMQQEAGLRATKGNGMTDEQVKKFVDGYYPAYELFTDTLRAGIFGKDKGRQLRLVVGEDRKVMEVYRI